MTDPICVSTHIKHKIAKYSPKRKVFETKVVEIIETHFMPGTDCL
jgi:hypothetical protein